VGSFIEIGRDITQELRIEKRLSQTQKIEAIGTLAGGIAHDFNNILGGIFGYCDLALRAVSDSAKTASTCRRFCWQRRGRGIWSARS
jgi:nitrogen-specific signal transduction histidine kinase